MADFHLQTHSMTVGYDGRPLIRDISIGIRRGEIVTLIGPNGSGKSTILKSIARQLRIISGAVTINGQDLRRFSQKELATRMAVVLTQRMKAEWMTCREVVAAGRYPYTGRLGLLTAKDEAQVRASMEAVHALDLAEKNFDAVSDGQRQRILLARAICQAPEIIVLDEPTSFLDIRHKLELLGILRQMAKERGITVVMSLHEIDLAQKVSDKILCVKGDRLSDFGAPERVFNEARIRALYDIDRGFFDPRFGSIELPRPEGEPQVMVLSACGTGIPVYRALQKENTPFSAGILYTNDVDWQLARLLACEVIEAEPFHAITDEMLRQAKERMRSCARVIDAGVPVGPCNGRMRELLDYGRKLGKI